MTIQYTEKGEVNKRDEAIDGHEPLRDVPEDEITPRVAKLLALMERPHREEER